ncbi:hypothetical protein L596_030956 [Steinernema carpocapsae]|uniref:Uncharacterized protein n=2 Tax=Steinernema carpocapsae TaxID=34508 RepID=A0A4U5MHF7_STECR|nr:hypothetical protein L596_030956 [Steinernema carpocapsae]
MIVSDSAVLQTDYMLELTSYSIFLFYLWAPLQNTFRNLRIILNPTFVFTFSTPYLCTYETANKRGFALRHPHQSHQCNRTVAQTTSLHTATMASV